MLHALLKTTAICLLLANTAAASDQPLSIENDFTAKQRNLYLDAKKAFKQQDYEQYRRLKSQLTRYPLYPYLEHQEINRELASFLANQHSNKQHTKKEKKALTRKIDQFLTNQEGSHLGIKLRKKWLTHLASTKNWQDYKHYYRPHVKKTALKCFNLYAKIQTEKSFPHNEVQALWLNAKSQPKSCDPVFASWEKKGYINQDLLWQRHKLAVDKKNYSLAGYLQKKMNPTHRYLAELYTKTHKTPSNITNVKQLASLSNNANKSSAQKINDIIYNGLYRYAYKEPLHSASLLKKLSASYSFDQDDLVRLKKHMASRLINKDHLQDAANTIKSIPQEEREKPLERLLRKFIAQQDWQKIHQWVTELPEEQVLSDRWQYWQARSLEELQKKASFKQTTPKPQDIYTALATSRSFYGFLASDKLNTPYQFEDKPAPIDLAVIKQVQNTPAIQRAKELFLLNSMYLARTEWRLAVKGFSIGEYVAAGQLSHLWGWNRKAIEAMAGAAYWDDLTIRFPIVHNDIIHHKALKNNVPSSLIFSIARQESAWEFDARSRVGARGLMQIMPATARETAKKAKIKYVKKKLFEPEYNITLGSHYISGLLKRYDNNRALAIASYNAGPHRVKRWLSKTDASLPIDAWIEIIPFKETRRYVQNVLSYEVIYNYRQGRETSLLTLAEANASL